MHTTAVSESASDASGDEHAPVESESSESSSDTRPTRAGEIAQRARLCVDWLAMTLRETAGGALGANSDASLGVINGTTATLLGAIAELEQLGALVDVCLRDRPRGLDDVVTMLFLALGEYERVQGRVRAAAVAYGDSALLGPALKAECIDILTARDGMARSSAEKAVTAFPTYAAYREQLEDLAVAKRDAEADATVALVRVETLREISAALRVSKAERIFTPMREIVDGLARLRGNSSTNNNSDTIAG